MASVSGIFDSQYNADNALVALYAAGFNKEDISLVMSDKTQKSSFDVSIDDSDTRTAKGGLAGALTGGAIGALLVGLTAIGSIVIPGAGLLAVGPAVAAFSGAGAGAAVGGLTGALISAGVAESEANKYENYIKQGKAVLIVHTDDKNRAMAAADILRNNNALTEAA